MSQKTILEIYTIIQKYVAQKKAHPNYIDFYELYNLDPKSDLETLKTASKKTRKLFHPDQKIFIDNKYGFIYDEIMIKNNDLYNLIENERNRSIYDNDLKKQKEYYERANSQNNYTNKEEQKENNISLTNEEVLKLLERIIETTIYKYSFSVGFRSLEAATEGDYKKITRENNCRKLLTQIGAEKTKKAVQSINPENENLENSLLDFYNSIIDKPGLKEKTLPFFNACKDTVHKYGKTQLSQAINFYLRERVTKFFTNDHNARVDLEKAAYPKEDIAIFIYSYLHKNGYNLTNSQNLSIDELLFAFSEEIEKNLQKSK